MCENVQLLNFLMKFEKSVKVEQFDIKFSVVFLYQFGLFSMSICYVKLVIYHDSQFQKNKKWQVPSVVVALLAPGRICNILEVEKTLSSGPVSCLAPALRFLLLQLCKENIMK